MAHSCLGELWRVIELKCTELLGNSYSIPVEVADRWASGLDSWCLSGGVKFKLCSHPDTPRTKLVAKAELCWRQKVPTLEVKGDFPICTCAGRFLGEFKREGPPPHNKCGHTHRPKFSTHMLGRVLGPVRYEERKKIIGPRKLVNLITLGPQPCLTQWN